MKSLKDSFCQAITAFICFVINLLSVGSKREEEVLLTASVCGNSGNLSVNNKNDVENFCVNEFSGKGSENTNKVKHIVKEEFRKQETLQKNNVTAKFSMQKELCRIRVPCLEEEGESPP